MITSTGCKTLTLWSRQVITIQSPEGENQDFKLEYSYVISMDHTKIAIIFNKTNLFSKQRYRYYNKWRKTCKLKQWDEELDWYHPLGKQVHFILSQWQLWTIHFCSKTLWEMVSIKTWKVFLNWSLYLKRKMQWCNREVLCLIFTYIT